jgi:AcrR family transcriptional regulator
MATLTRPYFPHTGPAGSAPLGRSTFTAGRSGLGTNLEQPPAPRRARAKRGEGDKLRGEILDAVDHLLTNSPHREDAVSIRAVAEMVGCTPPAIYLHFFDKNELLFDVCARRFTQLSQAIDAAKVGIDDPLAALEAGLRAYVRFGLEHPEHYRILFMGSSILSPDQLDEMRRTGVTGISRLVDQCKVCIDSGVVSAPNAKMMSYGVWTIAHGIVSLMIAKPHVEWPKVDVLFEHVMGTYMNGLRTSKGLEAAAS